MRKINYLYLAIIVIFLYACSENVEFFNAVSPITRAVVDDNQSSISNPDLIWNWENISEIVLNTEKVTSGNSVTTPWTDGVSSSLSETFRKDIKKEDGWKMLFHTFKKTGLDSKQNYMCFYNQFTGFIKIFYYYEGEQKHQGVQWYIKTTGVNTKILDAPSYLSKPMSDPAANSILLFSNMNDVPTTGIEHGWNGFEFQVPRYCEDLTSIDFKIGAYERQITNYNLLGKEFLTTVGTITTTSQSSSGASKAIANIVGPEAKKFIDKLGGKVFGSTVILGKNLSSLISSISSSGYISAFKGGLDMIFGKTTTTSTSDVKLTTTGTIELGGTSSIETTTGIPTLNFNLYEVLNHVTTHSNINMVMSSASDDKHYLGVWSLKKKPVVYYERVVMLRNARIENVNSSAPQVTGEAPIPKIKHCDIEPVINPDLLPYIKDYSFSTKFIVYYKVDGKNSFGVDINETSMLYADDNNSFLEIIDGFKSITAPISPDSDLGIIYGAFWFDWGNVTRGNLLAVVSLEMTCDYQGKETKIYQSQVYEVDYGIDKTLLQPEEVHHPPLPIVVNYGYPYTNFMYGWN